MRYLPITILKMKYSLHLVFNYFRIYWSFHLRQLLDFIVFHSQDLFNFSLPLAFIFILDSYLSHLLLIYNTGWFLLTSYLVAQLTWVCFDILFLNLVIYLLCLSAKLSAAWFSLSFYYFQHSFLQLIYFFLLHFWSCALILSIQVSSLILLILPFFYLLMQRNLIAHSYAIPLVILLQLIIGLHYLPLLNYSESALIPILFILTAFYTM